jgi:flagellin
MNLSINQPSSSLSYIERKTKEREETDEKLSSGKSINSAADDDTGVQISSHLTSQINGYQQKSVNAQDQIKTNNVQESGLSAINESLQRANVLSIQSGSPLSDPSAIQNELNQLTEQINAVAGEVLGDPSFISGLDVSDTTTTQAALEDALSRVNESASALGAQSNALSSQVSTYETTRVNVSESRSRIEDTDYASVTSEKERLNVLLQAALINKQDEESRKGILINQIV